MVQSSICARKQGRKHMLGSAASVKPHSAIWKISAVLLAFLLFMPAVFSVFPVYAEHSHVTEEHICTDEEHSFADYSYECSIEDMLCDFAFCSYVFCTLKRHGEEQSADLCHAPLAVLPDIDFIILGASAPCIEPDQTAIDLKVRLNN